MSKTSNQTARDPAVGALRIGEVASRTAVSVEALRYYEQRGLLRTAARRANGYREYPADAPKLVRFIKRAQTLGFSIAEIADLVRLRERAWSGDAPRQLREAAASKVREIDRRVRQLNALRGALSELIDACDTVCPVCASEVNDATAGCASPNTPSADGREQSPLPCPLIEAFDTEDELEAIVALDDVARDEKDPPPAKRRPTARRNPPARKAAPSSRRTR